jgi:hypothetical protein
MTSDVLSKRQRTSGVTAANGEKRATRYDCVGIVRTKVVFGKRYVSSLAPCGPHLRELDSSEADLRAFNQAAAGCQPGEGRRRLAGRPAIVLALSSSALTTSVEQDGRAVLQHRLEQRDVRSHSNRTVSAVTSSTASTHCPSQASAVGLRLRRPTDEPFVAAIAPFVHRLRARSHDRRSRNSACGGTSGHERESATAHELREQGIDG